MLPERSPLIAHRRAPALTVAIFVGACAIAGASTMARVAAAQGLISVGAGGGAGFGNHNNLTPGGTHGAAYLQLHPPLLPFALRGDALVSRVGNNNSALSVMGDAVVLAPIPYLVPYALVGYGKYGIGTAAAQNGWNAGIGARVRLSNVAIYAEVRRHQRIGRDLFTFGLSR
ncbi:MAG: hypothetical protein ABJB66_01300 [Gemmatimonadaceae bacterium]